MFALSIAGNMYMTYGTFFYTEKAGPSIDNNRCKARFMPSKQNAVRIFKALGDENRIRILKMLCTGEKCACRLLDALNISQPTLSHHMKILCDDLQAEGKGETITAASGTPVCPFPRLSILPQKT